MEEKYAATSGARAEHCAKAMCNMAGVLDRNNILCSPEHKSVFKCPRLPDLADSPSSKVLNDESIDLPPVDDQDNLDAVQEEVAVSNDARSAQSNAPSVQIDATSGSKIMTFVYENPDTGYVSTKKH